MKRKPNNPRRISKTEYARLQADLEEYGDLGGIVHNETTDSLVGGNQRASVFDLVGKGAEVVITEERVTPTRTGETARGYVVWKGERYDYRRVRWDQAKEDAACLIANLRGGSWDWEVMPGYPVELLVNIGFDTDLLNTLNDDAANLALMLTAEKEAPPEDAGAQVDRAQELLELWQVQTGDVWEIPSKTANGFHRIVCGDCTDPQVVEQCMQGEKADAVLTDPPYGMGVDKEMSKKGGQQYGKAAAPKRFYADTNWDIAPPQETIDFIVSLAPEVIIWGGNYFFLPPTRCYLVWDKQNDGNQFADCELAWTNLNKPVRLIRHLWNGMLRKDKEERNEHPTQKPLGVFEWCIEQLSNPKIIIDPFAGSGTTAVACERSGRLSRLIEISPAYVAVTLQRLQDLGLQPVKVNNAD